MNLHVENISYSYDGKSDLWKNISFTVKKGDIFSIMGANGVGKSTLLNTIVGFLRPQSGEVYLEENGKRLYSNLDAKMFTEKISYVPQLSDSTYSFDVEDYILMGRTPHMGILEQPNARDRELTKEIMNQMGIYKIRHRRFNTLSGGQQRQAIIARAIVQEPSIIIMDEPTNHLDYGNQFRVIEMIQRLAEKGITVVLTTHMPEQALYLGHHTGILFQNRLLFGKTQDIITERSLEEIYHMKIKLIYVKEVCRYVCIPE